MKIEKYQGCGNDFLITSEFNSNFSSLAKTLCNRHLSFGGDGLIYVDLDNYFVRFFNKDGSEASLCGNGLRCVGLYLYRKGLFVDQIEIETVKHKYQLIIENISPFIVKIVLPISKINISKKIIKIDKQAYNLSLIDVGNKHAICFDEEAKISHYIAREISRKLHNINVNFVRIINRNCIRVLTYERGVGFTLSCGSGSFASALILFNKSLINELVNIEVNEGSLSINVMNLSISGSAKYVFTGENDEQL